MFDKPDGPWEIVPFARSIPTDEYVDRLDRWPLDQFLRPLKSDYMMMMRLRGLLSQSFPVGRCTNDEVIDIIVSRLVSHDLLIRKRPEEKIDSDGGGGSNASAGASASSSPSVPAPKAKEPEPNTFSGNHDGNAQASSLGAAAASGVPLVEECQSQGQATT